LSIPPAPRGAMAEGGDATAGWSTKAPGRGRRHRLPRAGAFEVPSMVIRHSRPASDHCGAGYHPDRVEQPSSRGLVQPAVTSTGPQAGGRRWGTSGGPVSRYGVTVTFPTRPTVQVAAGTARTGLTARQQRCGGPSESGRPTQRHDNIAGNGPGRGDQSHRDRLKAGHSADTLGERWPDLREAV
jgi:hypothetical protein